MLKNLTNLSKQGKKQIRDFGHARFLPREIFAFEIFAARFLPRDFCREILTGARVPHVDYIVVVGSVSGRFRVVVHHQRPGVSFQFVVGVGDVSPDEGDLKFGIGAKGIAELHRLMVDNAKVIGGGSLKD